MFRLIKNIPKTSWSSKKPLNIKPKIKTLLFLIFGLFLFGLGETLLLASGAGVSPWTVLAEGISIYSSYSVGWSTFWMSLAVLLLWIPLKQKPGIGTILNVIIIALVFDYTLPYLPNPENYGFKVLQVIIGVLITGLGSGFYLISNLGPGPRDGLMTGVQRITGKPIALVRSTIEVIVVFFGWKLGGTVGLGTIIFALGIGPTVAAGIYFVSKNFK
ncbi:MAG: hypothetical protein JKY39_01835 [Pelagibacteraceae bacterium]|nr:hypothetical protein [Pelagibacteraceae bacterium]MCH2377610.1 hypothetical protein [Pelagibacterales bacterium]